MEQKMVTIFNQRLAGYLMMKKFVLVSMRPDRDGSGRNLFFFNDSENIRKEMDNFRKQNQV